MVPNRASHHRLFDCFLAGLFSYYGRLGWRATLWTNQMEYVIVIARGQGFMAVNEPSPRAKPEDKVCHKSLATRAITDIYPT